MEFNRKHKFASLLKSRAVVTRALHFGEGKQTTREFTINCTVKRLANSTSLDTYDGATNQIQLIANMELQSGDIIRYLEKNYRVISGDGIDTICTADEQY